MEGLGVGSGGALWPFLATNTCKNTGRSVLGLPRAFHETTPDAFVFMSQVCLSAALPRSYLLGICSLRGVPLGSPTASWRDGQPERFLRAANAWWPPVGNGGGVPCGVDLKQRDRTKAKCAHSEWRVVNSLPETPDAFALRAALWLRAC